MRILYVEDSPRLLRSVTGALERTGYAVDTAADGEEALWRIETTRYDAIVLDIMLPKLDGLTLLARMRAAGNEAHVLLLTARDTVADRVEGLRIGADDYLIKPFALEELLARVAALCRRAYGAKQNLIVVGDLTVDTGRRAVTRAGHPIDLTAREYNLVEYLARRQGEVVTRAEIEEHIYNDESPTSNAVDSAICTLRRKLAEGDPAPLIHTRRGLGYVLEPADA
ncbi:MAG: response regulator transcription factor [Steroidobacteraceae bacterium]